jgi:hypothetical protein
MSAPAPPAAPWEIKASRLLVRLLEDRRAPVDERLRILAGLPLPQEDAKRRPRHPSPAYETHLTRSMAESSLVANLMILRNHPDLSTEERGIIKNSIRQAEDLLDFLREHEKGY